MKDESSMDSLTIDELKAVLAELHGNATQKLELLGMDACYMAMGEVAYELRDDVDILIAAEGLEPAFGWPYDRILQAAKRRQAAGRPHLPPRELAVDIVDEYVKCYSDYDRSAGIAADLAAIDLSKLEIKGPPPKGVVPAFKALVASLSDVLAKDNTTDKEPATRANHNRLLLAHWHAQTYKADQFVDLKDLCEQLKICFATEPALHAKAGDVIQALEECVIRSGCSGFATQYSYGFSIYFPWGVISPDYRNLGFAGKR